MTDRISDNQKSNLDPDPPKTAYPRCPVVDAHVHVFQTELLESISAWFERNTTWELPQLDSATVVERIERRTDGFVFFPYAHRPGVAREMNEFVARYQEQLDSAVALGTVHAGDDSPKKIVTAAFEQGLHGMKIHCPVQGFAPDDERLDPVYEQLVSHDAPLIIHASSHPFYREHTDLGPECIQNVLERFPELRICIPHLGLFETAAFLDLADEYTVYFDTAVTLGDRENSVIDLQDNELPVDRLLEYDNRIMFGSDYPIRPLPYEDAFRGIVEQFPTAVSKVFYENACRFYNISIE